MKQYYATFVLVVLACLFVAGCQSHLVRISGYGREFELSDMEITNFTARAVAGDADAAIRLSECYGMIKIDYVSERKWMEVAAESGNVGAQYNAGVLYEEIDPNKSRYWMQRAADSGYIDAEKRLAELKSK
jgi:TPR repeat protein